MEAMAGRPRVLVVEDDADIAGVLRRSLDKEGYDVRVAGDGEAALEQAGNFEPDAVVLDLGLPKLDGVEVCRRLRNGGDVPILILTARDAIEARVEGLDSGADDYLVKPFELDELLARVRALLRRGALAAGPPAGLVDEQVLTFADLHMNTLTREVNRAGSPLELTRTEYTLLEMLLLHPRQVLTRERILETVWGFTFEPASNSLDVYVMYLRRKTEAGGLSRLIHTVRGVGYVLREPAAP
jgi:two-component system, OmpR family, response regulator MprA